MHNARVIDTFGGDVGPHFSGGPQPGRRTGSSGRGLISGSNKE